MRELPPWRKHAACVGLDTNRFYPEGDHEEKTAQIADAKSICGTCLVKEQCLELAIRNREPDGIFGGMTKQERDTLRIC